MTKAPTPTEKFKKQRDNVKRHQKLRLHTRLRADLGRSVGETTAPPPPQLVLLNRF